MEGGLTEKLKKMGQSKHRDWRWMNMTEGRKHEKVEVQREKTERKEDR